MVVKNNRIYNYIYLNIFNMVDRRLDLLLIIISGLDMGFDINVVEMQILGGFSK